MAQRALREYDAKRLINKEITKLSAGKFQSPQKFILANKSTCWKTASEKHSWINTERLAVKPDQLIGCRARNGLLLLDTDKPTAIDFIQNHLGKRITLAKNSGILSHFIIEPFIPHEQHQELYVSINTYRDKDTLLISMNGGVDIEENWKNIITIDLPIGNNDTKKTITSQLPPHIPAQQRLRLGEYLTYLHQAFTTLDFCFLEINPLLLQGNNIYPLDLKSRIDDTAYFQQPYWKDIELPAAFGESVSPEEEKIKTLNEMTGSSLKLTILNPKGKIWLLIAGGGASVVYTDTIADLGYAHEIANYGEYSGNPSADALYQYTSTLLDLMTRDTNNTDNKVLLIGGGIANFTDVAKTFTGIIKAITQYREKLAQQHINIYIRRGGPNYQVALNNMKQLGATLHLPIEVYGPETCMTHIVTQGINTL